MKIELGLKTGLDSAVTSNQVQFMKLLGSLKVFFDKL